MALQPPRFRESLEVLADDILVLSRGVVVSVLKGTETAVESVESLSLSVFSKEHEDFVVSAAAAACAARVSR